MAEALTGINGSIIKWAREYYNMSQEDAAFSIGIDLERYKKWEEGTDFPTYAKLKQISNVFHKPCAIFFFPTPPELPSIKGDLRTLSTSIVDTLSKNVVLQFEKAKVYQLNLQELYGNRESIIRYFQDLSIDRISLCKELRQQLEFPISAQKARKSDKVVFEIFREKFYNLGIYVFKDAFKDNSVSGLCVNDKNYPIILINNAMSFARQNFTLFHELYHLIANTSGVEIVRDEYYAELNDLQKSIEKECDCFANEFLVPTKDIEIELKKQEITEKRIAELATLYSVSKEVIMYKLYDLHLISSDDYTALKEYFYGDAIRSKQNNRDSKSGGNYYFTKLSYLGHQYTGEVFSQYFSGKIDTYRASEMLSSKVEHLSKLESTFFRGMQ